MSCPICHKRKPQRYCPALGEKICAICCGTEREVSLDCPLHCPYLAAAHRYEEETHKVKDFVEAAKGMPFADVNVPRDVIIEHQTMAVGVCAIVVKFAAQRATVSDRDVVASLSALAETTRTAASGIYYETRPDDAVRRDLYGELADFLNKLKTYEAERGGSTVTKDSDVFHVFVFLVRLGLRRSNGRPRSKAFLGFLQRQFPPAEKMDGEESRLIIP